MHHLLHVLIVLLSNYSTAFATFQTQGETHTHTFDTRPGKILPYTCSYLLCPYSLHLTDIFKASPTLFYASQCKNKRNNSKIKWNTWNGSANLSVTEIMMGFGLFMKRCWHHISVWVVDKQCCTEPRTFQLFIQPYQRRSLGHRQR